MEWTAYDYERQYWVTGDQALPLLRDDLTALLSCLESDGAAEFCRWVGGDPADLPAMVATRRRELEEVNEALRVSQQSRHCGA